MLLPFGSDRLVVFPNPLPLLFGFWAYSALCMNIVDANVDVCKTDAIIDAVRIDGYIFLANCTSILINL